MVTLSLYLLTAAAIIVSKRRYERRRRVLDRVEEAVRQNGVAGASGIRVSSLELLDGVSSRQAGRLAFEQGVPRAVNEFVASFLVTTVGVERWQRTAVPRGRRVSRWRRIAALRVLALAAPQQALPALETALADADTEVVAAAAAALGGMKPAAAGEALVRALERGYFSPSRLATFIERFATDIPDAMRPLLFGSTPTMRYWGAVLSRRYAGVAWIEERVQALTSDPAPTVRKAAIQSLAALGAPGAVAVAAAGLGDPIWYVRAHAARALGELRASGHAREVTPLLADREWWVRQAAKDALVMMGAGAEEAVMGALSHADRFARNSAAEILQNTGALERLLSEAAVGAGSHRQVLGLVREAGGPRLVQAVVQRLPEALRPRALDVLASIDRAEVV